jgi:hypothetical protein
MTQIPQTISPLRQRMIDDMTLRHVMVWINLRIGTSNQPGKIQIPMALRPTQTPAKPPAVSSLEACPTPAL